MPTKKTTDSPACPYCYEKVKIRQNGLKYGYIGNVKYQRYTCDACHSTYYIEIDFYTKRRKNNDLRRF